MESVNSRSLEKVVRARASKGVLSQIQARIPPIEGHLRDGSGLRSPKSRSEIVGKGMDQDMKTVLVALSILLILIFAKNASSKTDIKPDTSEVEDDDTIYG